MEARDWQKRRKRRPEAEPQAAAKGGSALCGGTESGGAEATGPGCREGEQEGDTLRRPGLNSPAVDRRGNRSQPPFLAPCFSDSGLAWSIGTSDLKSSASSPLLSRPRILLGRWMHWAGKAQGCSLATEGRSAPGLQLAAGMCLALLFFRIQLDPRVRH